MRYPAREYEVVSPRSHLTFEKIHGSFCVDRGPFIRGNINHVFPRAPSAKNPSPRAYPRFLDVEGYAYEATITKFSWWHRFLHNQTALFIRTALLFRKRVVVTSMRYYLK